MSNDPPENKQVEEEEEEDFPEYANEQNKELNEIVNKRILHFFKRLKRREDLSKILIIKQKKRVIELRFSLITSRMFSRNFYTLKPWYFYFFRTFLD